MHAGTRRGRAAEVVGWGWRAPRSGNASARRLDLGSDQRLVIPCFASPSWRRRASSPSSARSTASSAAPTAGADGIVALTGGAQRIGDAIDLLAKGYGRRLLITGVNERTSRDEIARLNPGQRRLFDCCVDSTTAPATRSATRIETRRWMANQHFRSLIVVTSNYHMPRTLLELDSALPEARKVPFAVVNEALHPDAWWRSPATARLLASEYVKFLAGWVRTRMEKDPDQITTTAYAPVRIAAEPLAN
jgi:uncharacterized SAM-binding protein YcdF (DUF218 family)